MTYGWAIAVVLVGIAVLGWLTDFDASDALPAAVITGGPILPGEAKLSTDATGNLRLALVNNLQTRLTLQNATLTIDGGSDVSCAGAGDQLDGVALGPGEQSPFLVFDCTKSGGAPSAGDRLKGTLLAQYVRSGETLSHETVLEMRMRAEQ